MSIDLMQGYDLFAAILGFTAVGAFALAMLSARFPNSQWAVAHREFQTALEMRSVRPALKTCFSMACVFSVVGLIEFYGPAGMVVSAILLAPFIAKWIGEPARPALRGSRSGDSGE